MRGTFSALLAALLIAAPSAAQQRAERTQQATERQKLTLRATLLMPSYGDYRLSPDGRHVLFTKSERDPEDWESTSHIWVHELATGRTYQLTNSRRGERNPRWTPDGRVVFTSNRDTANAFWVIPLAGGEATKYFDDDDAPADGSFTIDFARVAFTEETERPDRKEWEQRVKKRDDGYYAEQKLTYDHIWVYDPASKQKRQLTFGTTDNHGPTWSPDGRWIAFTSNRTGTTGRDANWSNNTDIFLIPSDSGAERRLTANAGPDGSPTWSPDGQLIAYASSDYQNNSADQRDLKVIRVAGGEPINLTQDFDYSVSNIEWSKDGRSLYFSAAQGLSTKLYRIPATGGEPTLVSLGDGFVLSSFQPSHDGTQWLVTGATLAEPRIVYLTNVDGRRPRRILEEHDRLADFHTARAEAITWKGADDWDIEGVLTYPLDYQPGQRYPFILQVHGGPHGRFSATFNTSAQIWAARGYAVLQGNPRGSSGRTFEFSNANRLDWGGKDFQDLMKGVDHVIERGVADPERMAVMGGSYGGFMTFWTVTQTNRFRAAIGHAGISDWYSFFGQTDIPNLLEFGFGGLPTQTKEVYERWSPIEFAENVTTPLLITHGEEDERVPMPQADQYFRLLKKLGKTVEFLRYPREGHGIREPLHRLHLDAEQEKWFDRFVLKKVAVPVSDARR